MLIYSEGGISVSTYAGPAGAGPRKRVQISTTEQVIALDMDQWSRLRDAVMRLGPDCEGRELP